MLSNYLEKTLVVVFLLLGTISLFLINFSLTGFTILETNTTTKNQTIQTQTIPEIQNLTNFTIINTTINQSIEEQTIQYQAVINKPVKWNKIINLSSPLENITVILPKESENIKIISEKEHTVKIDGKPTTQNLITGNLILENENSLLKILKSFFKFTGFSILEDNNATEIEILGNVSDFIIEYETPAPHVMEENINNKKRITVYSDIHYENILTYAALEQEVEQGSAKLYHLINNTRIEVENAKYLDTNNNSLIDYIEWITPSLSNQTYEVDIIILNVQSFPIVGGYWTVQFNTTGTANLTIKGINGTTFNHADFNEPDLAFVNLSCGNVLQNISLIENGIFIENYNCDNITGLHTVKVLTSGEHIQQFTFGNNKTVIAKNIASGGGLLENQTWQGSLLNVSHGSITAGDINGDGNIDLVIVGRNESADNLSAEVYLNNGSTFLSNSTDWSINITKVGGDASAILGDIDNDNDLDLVVGGDIGGGDGRIYSYLNNGTGFAYSFSYSNNVTMGMQNLDLLLEDIDLDGDLDLLMSGDQGSTTNTTAVWLNNGTSFAQSATWGTNITRNRNPRLAMGDLDSDGDPDLVFTGADGATDANSFISKIFINNGSEFLENATWESNLTKVGNEPYSILGDINNDGNLDLVITGGIIGGRRIKVYFNNGTHFNENNSYVRNLTAVTDSALSLADVDNDGDLDLFVSGEAGGCDATNRVGCVSKLYENNGSEFYENTTWNTNLTATGVVFGSHLFVDMDKDNDLDLILLGITGVPNGRALTRVFENTIGTDNTAPTAPLKPTLTYSNNQLNISFTNGSDTETSSNGLYYNLKVGTTLGGNQTISSAYGYGSSPSQRMFGNMFNRREVLLNVAHINYTVSVQSIDAGYKSSTFSTEAIYNATTIPRVSQLTEIPDPVSQNNIIYINATVTDDGTIGTVILQINFSNGTFTNYSTTSVGNNYFNASVSTSLIGNHSIRWSANDTSNNINSSEISLFGVIAASVSPNVTQLTEIPDPVKENGTIYLNATVVDDGGVGIVILQINFSNGTFTNYSTTAVGNNYFNASVSTSLVGNHSIRWFANDTSNNINSSEISLFQVNATNFAPNVTSLTESPDPVTENSTNNGGTIFINATVVDDGNIDTVRLQINFSNGTFTNYSTTAVGNNYYNASVPIRIVGNHSIRWSANDTVGNVNSSEISLFGVISETVPPNISNLTERPDPQNISGIVELNLTCDDSLTCNTLIAEVILPNSSKQNLTMFQPAEKTDWTNRSVITSIVGTYNYTIYANDTRGNINNTENSSFIIQSIITITSNATRLPFNVNGSISGNLSNGSTSTQAENLTFFNTTLGPRAIVTAFFNNSNINLNNITLLGNATATVVNFSQAIGLASTFTMIVPNTLSNGIIICPNVSILADVNISCPGITTFTLENALSNSTINGLTISLNGNNFWISNVTGTGAGENANRAGSVGTKGTGSSSLSISSTTDFDKINKKEITMTKTTILPFMINKEKYTLDVENIVMDYAVIRIKPTDISIKIQKGENKQLDVNKDGVNDLNIFLKEVVSASKLDLVIERISLIQESEIKTDELNKEEFTIEEKLKIQAPMQEENQDNDLINTRKPITTILIFLALLVFLVIELYEKKSSIKNTLKDIKQKFKK